MTPGLAAVLDSPLATGGLSVINLHVDCVPRQKSENAYYWAQISSLSCEDRPERRRGVDAFDKTGRVRSN